MPPRMMRLAAATAASLAEAASSEGRRCLPGDRPMPPVPTKGPLVRTLIFGGAGFVGLNIAEASLQAGYAVTAFDRFLQALQRGGRLISLLSQNKDLVALVALVLGAAPRLSDMLARQPQIMDGLIDPRFFGAMPDQATIAKANEENITLLSTEKPSFYIVGKLWELGLREA